MLSRPRHFASFIPLSSVAPFIAMASSSPRGIIPPPVGVEANFVNPIYHSGGIVPITAVFVTLSTVFLALRIYTKVRIIKVFGLEDGMFFSRIPLSDTSTYDMKSPSRWHGYEHLLVSVLGSHFLMSMVSYALSAHA